jgi:hypothetical protein
MFQIPCQPVPGGGYSVLSTDVVHATNNDRKELVMQTRTVNAVRVMPYELKPAVARNKPGRRPPVTIGAVALAAVAMLVGVRGVHRRLAGLALLSTLRDHDNPTRRRRPAEA